MLRIVALICLWIVLVPTAFAFCVMAGFLAGMFAGWIAMGEPLLCGIIGAIGAVVAVPLALKAMKESLRIPSVFAQALENQEPVTADDDSPMLNHSLRVAMIALGPLLIATLAEAAWEWYIWLRLQANGRPVAARVEMLGSSSTWRTAWNVTYRITPPGLRRSISHTQEVDRDFYYRLKLGDPLQALYFPDYPDNSRLIGDGAYREYLSRMAGLQLATLVGFLTVGAWVRSRRKLDQPTGVVIE